MLATVLPMALLAGPASAAMYDGYQRYFSIGHAAMVRTRLDPLISPDKVSSHVHNYVGSSAFTESMDYASATGGKCTTSYIQDDMSGYWAPQLYYKYKNGTYLAIASDGLVAYWKYSFNTVDEEFAVVPDDFRMVAGDINRDHFDPTQASHKAISFECIGDGFDITTNWIPADRECKTIRPQAFFPNCWNGKDAYLEGNKHVAYPEGENFEGGKCPEGFVRMPSVFLEAYYHVADYVPDYEWYPGCLVFANGDNYGLSYHSDWQNGWPSGLLVDAYKTCGSTGLLQGTVDGCSVFEASRDRTKAEQCVTEGTVADEITGVGAAIEFLPGNNVEFNSSRDSDAHTKASRPGYTENTQLIPVPADGTGVCAAGGGRRECTEVSGADAPQGSGDDTATSIVGTPPSPTASVTETVSSETASTTETSDVTTSSTDSSAVPTGSATGLPAGPVLIADPSDDSKETVTVTATVTEQASCPTMGVRSEKRLARRERLDLE